jgi:hypothetical protein
MGKAKRVPVMPSPEAELARALAGLSADTRQNMLRSSAAANDGSWFYETAKRFGIDAANELNASVVRRFAELEMVRLLRELRVDQDPSSELVAKRLIRFGLELFVGELFHADLKDEPGRVYLRVSQCFAYEGVRRAGVHKEYRCGPGQRLAGWLAGIGTSAHITPAIGLCQMAHTGHCTYAVNFDTATSTPAL